MSTIPECDLHFIWKNRLYTHLTYNGDEVKVYRTGIHNMGAGPDFSLAHLQIDDLEWYGSVEIHRKASEWYSHGHHKDSAYDGTILHVVLEDDQETYNSIGRRIPTAIISIDDEVLQLLQDLRKDSGVLRCTPEVTLLSEEKWDQILEGLLTERLYDKVNRIRLLHPDEHHNTILYHLLMRYLGALRNNEAMTMTAASLPYTIIKKHSYDVTAIEAMLIGQAALFNEQPYDEYEAHLQEEYRFYANKFGLTPIKSGHFRRLRVRPTSYPTRMLAIAAKLITDETRLHDAIDRMDQEQLMTLLRQEPSSYWTSHYDFGKTTHRRLGGIGTSTATSLLINAIIPYIYDYHDRQGATPSAYQAIDWLRQLPAERNQIISYFEKYGKVPRNAGESQAMIQLYNNLCNLYHCLSCQVASEIFTLLHHRQ